jgi:20S proteasome alpha/beta subunit
MLIAGASDDGELCLWAVDSGEVYLHEMRTWECYGSGIDAAEMLMKDLYFPEITVGQAVPLLAYVVHAVSEICIDCGGPIDVVTVDRSGVRRLPREFVEGELGKVRPMLDRLRKELPRRILRGERVEV